MMWMVAGNPLSGRRSGARLPPMVRLSLLGFGLIGGSIARALAERDPASWVVTAWSRTREDAARGLADGVLAAVASDPESAADASDLTVLAASPTANLELVDRVGPVVARAGGLLSDVSSVQGPIAARAEAVAGLRFVGGHPMSGHERRGYAASDAALFVGRPWVVLPGRAAGPGDVALVRRLAEAVGARPIQLDALLHDRAVAWVSHLPLLASISLVEAATAVEGWDAARLLAAQGWRDMTRLARTDPDLAAGIIALNAAALVESAQGYRAALDGWLQQLAGVGRGEVDASTLAARWAEIADRAGDAG